MNSSCNWLVGCWFKSPLCVLFRFAAQSRSTGLQMAIRHHWFRSKYIHVLQLANKCPDLILFENLQIDSEKLSSEMFSTQTNWAWAVWENSWELNIFSLQLCQAVVGIIQKTCGCNYSICSLEGLNTHHWFYLLKETLETVYTFLYILSVHLHCVVLSPKFPR